MQRKFIPTLTAGNGYTYLKLQGILDEDNLLVNLLSQIQGRLLLIELSEIERINSCGVRDWVNWLNQILALGVHVILLKCSPPVVNQANMVANFASDAFIHSFYAPYSHPDTGEEQAVLLFTEELRQTRPVQPPRIYSDDGQEMEFEEFPESYFAFIDDPRVINYQMPADIKAVVDYFVPESQSHAPVMSPKSTVQPPTNAPIPHVSVPTPKPQIRHEQPPLPHHPFEPPRQAPQVRAAYNPSPQMAKVPPASAPATPPISPMPPANPPPSSLSIAEQQELARRQAIAEQAKAQQAPPPPVNIPQAPAPYTAPPTSSAQNFSISPYQNLPSEAHSKSAVNSHGKVLKLLIAAILFLLVILLALLLFIKFK